MNFLPLPVISFLVSLGAGFFMIKIALCLNLLDVPGPRSSHKKPTPTMGGLAIIMAFFLGVIIAQFSPIDWETPRWLGWFLAGAGLVAAIGLIDDLRSIPILSRLFLYGIAAGVPIAGGIRLRAIDIPVFGMIEFGILDIPITVLWIMAVVNFYNFMDGIDGLAAGVGVIVTGFLAYIAWGVGNSDILVLSLLLGGSCLGFAWHNFPPAKIFMGDVGSTFIGYILAVVALIGNQSEKPGYLPFFVPVLLLGTFLFDTVVTLTRRTLRREKWYLSHREHYYQKMTNLGFSQLQISLGEYGVTFLLGISALLYIRTNQALAFPILFIWLILLIGIVKLITSFEKESIGETMTTGKVNNPFFRLGELFRGHRQIIRICGLGLLLRVSLALSIYYFAPLFGLNRLIAPDAINLYEPEALQKVLPAFRGEIDLGPVFFEGRRGYILWLGFVYFLFGHHPLIPILINCLLGTVAIAFIYFLTKEIFDHKTAFLVSALMAMAPSLIFWNALNLKESWVYALVSGIILLYYLFEKKEDFFILLPLGLGFLWLSWTRQHISVILLGALIVSTPVLFSRAKKIVRLGGPLLLTGIMFLVTFSNRAVLKQLLQYLRPDYIKEYVKLTEIGGSSLGGLSFLERLFAFLFFPLPWKTVGLDQAMTIPEMIVWYLLFPFFVLGLIGAIRENLRKVFPILLLVVLLPLFYVFFFRNLGWLYRYKSFLMPYLFMFGAYGITLSLRFYQSKNTKLVNTTGTGST